MDGKSHMAYERPLDLAIIGAGISKRGAEKPLSLGRSVVFGDLRLAPTPSHKPPKPLFQTYGAMVAFTR